MKTITEIFKDNPQLLETDEVKELIDQFKYQFNVIKKQKMAYWDKVTEISMNSECFVIGGTNCKLALERIINYSFEIPAM